ncbi:uncharacterized protein A4U43_C07F16100 [Asparagus officinalis]|uniref:PROP1-like PPR domain-containing protein n=1 Tax=Asparagus officinalis TaxID=4686 RepID=A0A5P1ECL9_ASPOF|nr:pentatricopeptide repeat-containing protein At1g01970 [Asparagus officinalis]ONK63523.1 uncharacterized protein A4U43_C07F16100 [Asparagus officinalis]
MLCTSQFMLSNFYPNSISTIVAKEWQTSPWKYVQGPALLQRHNNSPPISIVHSTLVALEREEENVEEEKEKPKIKWHDVGPDITEAQKEAITQLPPKMTNRCKAIMKRIICFTQDEVLSHILAAWVKVMKPRRSDWLTVLKELKRTESPLLLEVMDWVLLEESFEANARDYTKVIDTYAKHNLIEKAESTFQAMKKRGFPCDQVTLTVLIHMYSKAGNLNKAKEAFQEIQFLGLPLDRRAYDSMIMAYIRAGELNLAENLMKETEAKEIYAGREVYKALLRAYSIIGNSDGAQRVFDAIQFARIVPDSKLCALLINAYCVGGETDKALSVLENMKSVGLKPNGKCVVLVLEAYDKENSIEKALAFLKDLEDDGVKIDEEASEILEQWFQRLGVVDDELRRDLRKLCLEKKGRLKLS